MLCLLYSTWRASRLKMTPPNRRTVAANIHWRQHACSGARAWRGEHSRPPSQHRRSALKHAQEQRPRRRLRSRYGSHGRQTPRGCRPRRRSPGTTNRAAGAHGLTPGRAARAGRGRSGGRAPGDGGAARPAGRTDRRLRGAAPRPCGARVLTARAKTRRCSTSPRASRARRR